MSRSDQEGVATDTCPSCPGTASFHLLGVGGIGMSGLARLLHARGCSVSGSDNSADLSSLPLSKRDPGATVVVSSAIPADHPERAGEVIHRSDLLAYLLEGYRGLAVAGTHGKTTASALLAWVLRTSTFAIGGLLEGVNAGQGEGDLFIFEADESDSSFLRYSPFGALVTNVDAEHLDHHGSVEAMEASYVQFLSQVAGPVVLCGDDPWLRNWEGIHYGFGDDCDLRVTNFNQRGFVSYFTLHWQGQSYPVELALIGRHNALNAAGVFGLALEAGATPEAILTAFASFPGISRRCERLSDNVINDYGHHPVEIAATLAAIREAVGERRITAIVQPHRYSRCRNCDFSTCTAEANRTFVTDIYAAGEAPIAGITPQNVMPGAELWPGELAIRPHDVVVCFGAGDINRLAHKLATQPIQRYRAGVICGGPSPEADISRISAGTIAKALSPDLYTVQCFEFGDALPDDVEVWLPIFHGPSGEDGLFAAYAELMGKPYVGPDFRASHTCMDKVLTKQAVAADGIRTAPWVDFWDWQWAEEQHSLLERIAELQYPLFVKGAHLGSGIGVYHVMERSELLPAIEAVLSVDNRILVEQGISGREFELGVMGNDKIEVSPPGEVVKGDQFFSSERRYGPNSIPRDLYPEVPNQEGLQAMAARIYRLLGCTGHARVDTFMDPDGHFWLNEVNPIPGFTPTSMVLKLWKRAGYTVEQFVDRLIILALARG